MSLSEDIKDFALDIGYSGVGITTADSFPDYITELKARYEMYSYVIEGPLKLLDGAEPRKIMPSAKSIVTVVYDASKEAFPENLLGKIGRLYMARCYRNPYHRINGARRKLMREFLERNGCEVKPTELSTIEMRELLDKKGAKAVSPLSIPERLTAARAGATTYGRNTFAFADGIGSFIHITSFVIDVELEYDEPTMEVKCPPKCTVCIDACPTGALYEPLKMNPRKCIAFNTFNTRDDYMPGLTSYIPPEIRKKMGTWIHGCDVCQEVCPRNQKRLKAKLPPNEFLFKIAQDFDLTKLLNLTDEFYDTRVQPLNSCAMAKKYFQRNAAIAMGNVGDPAFIPQLTQAMQDPEWLVRGYAAWALGRIGGSDAKQVLVASLSRETDDFAKKEIDAALAAA